MSLDIETYGKLSSLPEQRCFNPRRSLVLDKVPLSQQVLTACITLPKQSQLKADNVPSWNTESLGALVPGVTMQLDLRRDRKTFRSHLYVLASWLGHCHTLLGMNLPFDLLYLRACFPELRPLLAPYRHQIIDLSVVNFLESDTRPERSLKNIGPVLGLYCYAEEDLQRLSSVQDILDYNAQDTHNTMNAVAAIARRIATKYPGSQKLSPYCNQFYSDSIWACVQMAEAGVPFHKPTLQALHDKYLYRVSRIEKTLEKTFNLKMSGDGTNKSKQAFLEHCIDAADVLHPDNRVRADPRLELTPKKGEISFTDGNRALLTNRLPSQSPEVKALSAIGKYTYCQKLLSSYTFPYLLRSRKPYKGEYRINSVIVPNSNGDNRDVYTSHTSWFIVPSRFKDDQGSAGGTIQARLTCKDGAHQTDPPPIQATRASRWHGGYLFKSDASQIELRVPTILSGEPTMLEEFRKEKADPHRAMAIALFGESVLKDPHFHDGSSLDPRQWSKQVNFLILFRGGPDKLQATILAECGTLLPMAQCIAIVDAAKAARATLWAWQDTLIEEAKNTGKIVLPITGQSRTFAGGDDYEVNEIVNFPVQTHAANVTRDVMHRVGRAIRNRKDILMYLNVYDAIMLDVKDKKALQDTTKIFRDSVQAAREEGYWHLMCKEYGHEIPLIFEDHSSGPYYPLAA